MYIYSDEDMPELSTESAALKQLGFQDDLTALVNGAGAGETDAQESKPGTTVPTGAGKIQGSLTSRSSERLSLPCAP